MSLFDIKNKFRIKDTKDLIMNKDKATQLLEMSINSDNPVDDTYQLLDATTSILSLIPVTELIVHGHLQNITNLLISNIEESTVVDKYQYYKQSRNLFKEALEKTKSKNYSGIVGRQEYNERVSELQTCYESMSKEVEKIRESRRNEKPLLENNNSDPINESEIRYGVKNFNRSFLFSRSEVFQQKMMDAIMKFERIDTRSNSCENLRYELTKRQRMSELTQVLLDERVVLIVQHQTPMHQALKVFCARDIKTDRQLRIFIDCSNLLQLVDGQWRGNIMVLISYLINAMTQLVYYYSPDKIKLNATLMKYAKQCFATLFSYVIDFLYKINNIENLRNNCLYLSALYFHANILDMELNESAYQQARNIGGISERQAEMINLYLEEDTFTNIQTFINTCSKALKLSKLTVDIFVEKWIYIFKPVTLFAVELFPAFSAMLTDAYSGSYINNQKTIEKIVGKDMIEYNKTLYGLCKSALS